MLTPGVFGWSGGARLPRGLAWAVVALAAGVAIALLPPQSGAFVLGLAVLAVLSLLEPRVALLVALTVAPLKALTETELPLARELPLDVGQLALIALLGIYFARSITLNRNSGLTWTPLHAPLLLFMFAASLSLWTTVSARDTLKEIVIWLEILAMLTLIPSLARSGGVGWIVAAVLASAAIQALIGLYQFRGGSGAPHLWILDFRYFRAFGSFGQPNPFGGFMGLALPLALGATFGALGELVKRFRRGECNSPRIPGGQAKGRTAFAPTMPASGPKSSTTLLSRSGLKPWTLIVCLSLITAGIIGAGLLASWSRGAWLGFAAAAFVMVLFAPRRLIVGIGLVAIIGLVGGASILAGLAPESLVARFSDFAGDLTGLADVRGVPISDANYAVLERLAHWQAAAAMADESPWLGIGFGSYAQAYPKYALMNWPMALGHAHNYYLNLLAETGVVGLSAYLVLWMAVFGQTLRLLGRTNGFQRGVVLGLLGVWTHLAVHSLFDKLYVNNLFLHLGAMLGLIGALLHLVGPGAQSDDNLQDAVARQTGT